MSVCVCMCVCARALCVCVCAHAHPAARVFGVRVCERVRARACVGAYMQIAHISHSNDDKM